MKIELKDNKREIRSGCIITTECGRVFLITENTLDAPCRCSESMTEGYVAIDLISMTTWSVFRYIKDIHECFSVIRVIQPDNILLKEI